MPTDYERIADRYDDDRAQWVIPPDDIVVALADSQRAARVLDVGCGTGTWLRVQYAAAAASNVTLVGADPSAGMLAQAHAKGIPNLVRASAERLPVPDASIDYLVANFTFHHWDKEPALDEVARVVRPGAVFRINNIDPANTEGWWLYEYFPEAFALDAARFWPADRIAEEMHARGFDVDVQLDGATGEVPATASLAEAERRVISQLATLDDAAYERGLARLRKAAEVPGTMFTASRCRLQLTARRSA